MHICTVEATANARVQSLTKALSFLNDVRRYTVSSVHLGENPINHVIICPASVLLCLSLSSSLLTPSPSLSIYISCATFPTHPLSPTQHLTRTLTNCFRLSLLWKCRVKEGSRRKETVHLHTLETKTNWNMFVTYCLYIYHCL